MLKEQEIFKTIKDFNEYQLDPKDLKINLSYSGSGNGSASFGSSSLSSAGFGDIMGNILGNIRQSFANMQMASGGYGNITLNNSFTINNGGNITQQTVEAWADIITDRVNENLGRLV